MINILKKIINFSGDQKNNLWLGLLFGLIGSIFKLFNILAIAFVIKNIVEGTINTSVMWQSITIMTVGILGTMACNYVSTMRHTVAGYTMAANSRIKIADHLKNISMGFFNDNDLGKITSVATNSAELINDNLTRCMLLYMQGLIMSFLITASLFAFDWRLGIICLAGVIFYLAITEYQQLKGKNISQKLVSTSQRLVDTILEYIQGIAVVKSYNLVGDANKKVKNSIKEAHAVFWGMEKTFMPIIALQNLVFRVISFAMIACSIFFYTNGTMELFNAIMMCICSFLIFAELEMGVAFASLFRLLEGSIDEINKILSTPTMDDVSQSLPIHDTAIEIKNIDFGYKEKNIINNLSLSIPVQSTLAIVGGSGSGKTTLCHLITRFWDIDKGEIALGGKNIKDIKLHELFSQFSMVFQNVYLFNDTVANNIKFGKQNASLDEIKEACKKACCHDFIMSLPNEYDTMIGEGGASISGGEKQRISIARAIIKDSPIIILDEATANVDPENEYQLQLAIKELTKSKTVIMIAHRLKTVQHADNIIVLAEGNIIEQGKHAQLMKQNGEYAKFVTMREKAIGWKLGGIAE